MLEKKFNFFREFRPELRREILLVGLVMFGLLLTYPLIRSTTDALFLEHFKAKNSPQVWLLSSLVLIAAITWLSHLQKRVKIQKLFWGLSVIASGIFIVGSLIYQAGYKEVLFGLYALKETYIVMLVHITLAHLNNVVNVEQAKLLYGPLGAFGSLGGIIGASLVSPLVKSFGVFEVFFYSPLALVAIGAVFFLTKSATGEREIITKERPSPLASVRSVWKYVVWISLLISLTQFAINMGQFLFNLHFEKLFADVDSKAQALGQVYLSINVLSLFVQIVVTPIVLKRFKTAYIHTFIPVLYLMVTYIGFGLSVSSFLLVGGAYVVMKGVDYSLFSAAKELLYFPLDAEQKYGGKYIVDMVAYRFSKGLVSTFLIFFQGIFLVQVLLMLILVLWALTLVPLLKERHRLLARAS